MENNESNNLEKVEEQIKQEQESTNNEEVEKIEEINTAEEGSTDVSSEETTVTEDAPVTEEVQSEMTSENTEVQQEEVVQNSNTVVEPEVKEEVTTIQSTPIVTNLEPQQNNQQVNGYNNGFQQPAAFNNQPMNNGFNNYNQPMYNQGYMQPQKNNNGLKIAIVVVVLAIAAVVGYMFATGKFDKKDSNSNSNSNETSGSNSNSNSNEMSDSNSNSNSNSNEVSNSNSNSNSNEVSNSNSQTNIDSSLSITFDGFDITLKGYTFTKTKTTNKDVIKVQAVVKNNNQHAKKINMFYFIFKSPTQQELGSEAFDFDDSVDYASTIAPGTEQIQYFYIPYTTDGDYTIEFDNYTEKKTVKFNIKK